MDSIVDLWHIPLWADFIGLVAAPLEWEMAGRAGWQSFGQIGSCGHSHHRHHRHLHSVRSPRLTLSSRPRTDFGTVTGAGESDRGAVPFVQNEQGRKQDGHGSGTQIASRKCTCASLGLVAER